MVEQVLEEVLPYIEVLEEECKGCGLCIHYCPKGVIEASPSLNSHGYHPAHYKGDGCIGCGICFYTCPEPGAITVYMKGYKPPRGEGE
jgi:2-oxoglutarate ferredoxin oxidoreductase subunit delta